MLKAKVKIRNGNSGIQFRSKRAADGAVSGPQADVADGYWGLLYEERGRGILERYPEDKAKDLVKNGRLERVRDHRQGAARHDRPQRHADHRPRRPQV